MQKGGTVTEPHDSTETSHVVELVSAMVEADPTLSDDAKLAVLAALGAPALASDGRTSASPDVLAQAQSLILRAGDDSNLALDPDLDSYYLQAIVVTKLPAWLGPPR
jgi:hypothetical protein